MSFNQEIASMGESQFADLFNTGKEKPIELHMGSEEINTDLLSTTNQTTQSTTDQTTASTTEQTTQPPLEDVDLLKQKAEEDKNKDVAPLAGVSEYFKDRIEKGKFIEVTVENEKGETVPFIPKTAEEFDEVIELQVSHKLEEAKKEIDKAWYAEKSPAWKVVAQYADKIDNPAELIPFLTGVNNIQTVANLNIKEIEGAEELIRIQLANSGQPKELIDTQVEALKATNKLLETAEKLQPNMIQAEQRKLADLNRQKTEELNNYRNMVIDIRDNAVKAIETPIGKEKLKQEEKAAVYELIAIPDEESRGYAIFNKIDELFEKKDFEKLKRIALLITNEEAYNKYVSAGIADKTAGDLQKKLRLSSDKVIGTKDADTSNKTTIQRDTYRMPKFGRS